MNPTGKGGFRRGVSGNPGGRPCVIANLRDLARTHAPEVIKELARLALKARSEAVRVSASRELLDRGYGKAAQFLANDDDICAASGEAGGQTTEIRVSFVRPQANGHSAPPVEDE